MLSYSQILIGSLDTDRRHLAFAGYRNRTKTVQNNDFPDWELRLDLLFHIMSYTGNNLPAGRLAWAANMKVQMIVQSNWYNALDLYKALMEMKAMPLHTVIGRRDAFDVLMGCAVPLNDYPVDDNNRFPAGDENAMVCEELGAWRGEFVALRLGLTTSDRAVEVSGANNQRDSGTARAQMDSNVALPKMISEMVRQLQSRRGLINQAQFEKMFRLHWG